MDTQILTLRPLPSEWNPRTLTLSPSPQTLISDSLWGPHPQILTLKPHPGSLTLGLLPSEIHPWTPTLRPPPSDPLCGTPPPRRLSPSNPHLQTPQNFTLKACVVLELPWISVLEKGKQEKDKLPFS